MSDYIEVPEWDGESTLPVSHMSDEERAISLLKQTPPEEVIQHIVNDSSNIYRRDFTRIMREAGIGEWVKDGVKDKFKPAYRMYDLRHTCATLMLRGGVNAKVVSERLGHSSVAFTMDTYAAFLPEMQEEAADVLNIAVGGQA